MDYGVETINERPRLHMAVWLQVKVCGRELSLRHIGCTPALSVTQKCRCSCGMRLVALFKCYVPLHLLDFLLISSYVLVLSHSCFSYWSRTAE